MSPSEVREFIHAEIQFEHQLISNRMSWYVTSQSFLMTAFAIAGGYQHKLPWLTAWFLPGLGIAISVLIWAALLAALFSMSRLRKEENQIINTWYEFERLRFWDENREWRHFFGMLTPSVVPPLLIIAWIVMLVKAQAIVR